MSSSRPLHVVNAGALALALVITSCSSSGSGDHATHDSTVPVHTASLRDDMRKLWEDHITWTRNYIIAAEAGSPDTDATATRLLQNQTDIGDAIKPLYGDAAGTQLTSLLRDHILTAAD
ncbi:MAG TPA: hypothetical protein VIK05_08560, partial [Ilumatobacteraceae bacterium]